MIKAPPPRERRTANCSMHYVLSAGLRECQSDKGPRAVPAELLLEGIHRVGAPGQDRLTFEMPLDVLT
jgi:hypothetical protein